MLGKAILYFGQPLIVMCDGQCHKAWGRNNRPRVDFDPNDPDDMAFLADSELGTAPEDPGTYEGVDGKPQEPGERLNRWCVRECERSAMGQTLAEIEPRLQQRAFAERLYNQPWKHDGSVKE